MAAQHTVELYDGETGHKLITVADAAIDACSHPGSCDADVAYWAPRAKFHGTRDEWIASLTRTGGWSGEELATEDDSTIRERLLWVLCGSEREERYYRAKLIAAHGEGDHADHDNSDCPACRGELTMGELMADRYGDHAED